MLYKRIIFYLGFLIYLSIYLFTTKISYATQAPPAPYCTVTANIIKLEKSVFTTKIRLKIMSILSQTGDTSFYNCKDSYPVNSEEDTTFQPNDSKMQLTEGQKIKGTLNAGGDEFSNGVYLSEVSIIESTLTPTNKPAIKTLQSTSTTTKPSKSFWGWFLSLFGW